MEGRGLAGAVNFRCLVGWVVCEVSGLEQMAEGPHRSLAGEKNQRGRQRGSHRDRRKPGSGASGGRGGGAASCAPRSEVREEDDGEQAPGWGQVWGSLCELEQSCVRGAWGQACLEVTRRRIAGRSWSHRVWSVLQGVFKEESRAELGREVGMKRGSILWPDREDPVERGGPMAERERSAGAGGGRVLEEAAAGGI